MPLEEGSNLLITDLAQSEKMEQRIFATLSLDAGFAHKFINDGVINSRLTPALSRELLNYGLDAFLLECPANKRVPLIQEFIRSEIKTLNIKPKSFPSLEKYNQEIIQQAVKYFRIKIFPEDKESMIRMQPARLARLKTILEKLKEDKTKNPTNGVISKRELTRRITEIVGLGSPFKNIESQTWLKLIEIIAEYFIGYSSDVFLANDHRTNTSRISHARLHVVRKIINMVPELEQTFADLSERQQQKGWLQELKDAEKRARQREKDAKKVGQEVYFTETEPAQPNGMKEEGIIRWFVPKADSLESIQSAMVENAFLKHISGLNRALQIEDDKQKEIISTIVKALMNPDEPVTLSVDLLSFLIKISRCGKKGINQVAATILKLLKSR